MASYDRKTALIVVDMQNDFADPGGALSVAGGEEIVPLVNDQVTLARAAGALVFYTQDWHPPDTPHFAKDGGAWPVHCVRGTRGAAFHPGLKVEGETIRKGAGGEDGYSGFTVRDPDSGRESETGLSAMLHDAGIERVVVVGLATDYCVMATALDAVRKGFSTVVIQQAVRPVDLKPGDGQRALDEMRRAGVTIE
ncbi:MAG: isochorismatase family protein [Dehalococcoidia bacterium]|nr:isochorismatase family protein [Dehalococcoidia bacterium]